MVSVILDLRQSITDLAKRCESGVDQQQARCPELFGSCPGWIVELWSPCLHAKAIEGDCLAS